MRNEAEISLALKEYHSDMKKIDYIRDSCHHLEVSAWERLRHVLDRDMPEYYDRKQFFEVY